MHTTPEIHPTRSLLRRAGADRSRVGMVELFFDLVFVYAVTQLTHTLLAHLGWAEALRVGMLLLAVWLVWSYTAWFTNYSNPKTHLGWWAAALVIDLVSPRPRRAGVTAARRRLCGENTP